MPEEPEDTQMAIAEAKKKILAKKKLAEAEAELTTGAAPAVANQPAPQAKAEGKPKAKKPEQPTLKGSDVVRSMLKMVEKQFPTLSKDLKRAEMNMDATAFIARAITLSITIAIVVGAALLMLSSAFKFSFIYAIFAAPLAFAGIFVWMMQFPRLKIAQKERELDKDVLFAGRDMLIGLKSGVPLFNAMANVSRNYGTASREFSKIVERIQSGIPAEIALQEASDMNISRPFRQIILQIITSLRSGSDVAVALDIVLNQISQEQIISLKRYGQKLNPITMFYMLFGIILPSLGIAIGIILTSFINIKIDFSMLIIILVLLGIIQYIFLAMIRSSRPNFEV